MTQRKELLLREVAGLIDRGELRRALVALENTAGLKRVPVALQMRAHCELQLREFSNLLCTIERLFREDRRNPVSVAICAESAAKIGHLADAERYLDVLEKHQAQDQFCLEKAAFVLGLLGRNEEALVKYRLLAARYGRSRQSLLNIGLSARYCGDESAAIEAFEEALRQETDDLFIQFLITQTRKASEDSCLLPGRELSKAGQASGNSEFFHFALAKELEDLGDLEKAADHLLVGNRIVSERLGGGMRGIRTLCA